VSKFDELDELIDKGAIALYRLQGWKDRKPDWHSGDAEHLQAAAVIDAVFPKFTSLHKAACNFCGAAITEGVPHKKWCPVLKGT